MSSQVDKAKSSQPAADEAKHPDAKPAEMTPPNKKDLENKTPQKSTGAQPETTSPPVKALTSPPTKQGFLARNRMKIMMVVLVLTIVIALAAVPASGFFRRNHNYNVLSNQTFTFASTLDAASFKSKAGSVNFVKAVCGPIGIDTGVITALEVFADQTYNDTYTVTLVTLYFGSMSLTSNDFRDKVQGKLPDGYLANWQVIAFGEGLQVPKNFCPAGRFGMKCKKCGDCTNPLVCDDGTLGSGQCACPSIFMEASYFPYPGANLAFGRCLTLSADTIDVGNVSVESNDPTLQSFTIWNVGSTTESFSGAVIMPADNMSSSIASWLSISQPISWPQALYPGDFLTVQVSIKPTDAGKFWATSLLFIDNDPAVWWDDANTRVDFNFASTIAGQLPVDGVIKGQFALYRIDCGNSQTAQLGTNWYSIDAWFGSGSTANTYAGESNMVTATYRSFGTASAGQTHYTFPTKYDGDLTVNLIFKDFVSNSAGDNVFNIMINGKQANADPIDVFDLMSSSSASYLNLSYAYPGYKASAVEIKFQAVSGTPFVNAIEILQTLFINVSDYNTDKSGYALNYGEALSKALIFFESLRSGPMAGDRKLLWRNDSCMTCLGPNGEDLSGGFYEAGGNSMKFNFPMAWSIGQVAWGMIEYPNGFAKASQKAYALKNIKIALDYFINCYISDTQIAMSIGVAKGYDFNYFGPPEMYNTYVKIRPVWYITPNPYNRSSETLGEVAAVLAMGSMIWSSIDAAYSAKLLDYADKYFSFATTYPGSYKTGTGTGFTELQMLYPSNSYLDELAWGGLWLYRATKKTAYLTAAQGYYDAYQAAANPCGFAYSWEEKGPALHVLFALLDRQMQTRVNTYRTNAKCYFDKWLPGPSRTVPHTPRGLAYILPWGSARYAANTAWLAHVYANYLNQFAASSSKNYVASLTAYAKNQSDYILGVTGRSYMHGVGAVYPMYMVHKSSYNSYIYLPYRFAKGMTLAQCSAEMQASTYPQIHKPYGAVVGGPIKVNGLPSDFFIDSRQQYQYTEPGLDYSGCITALIAAYCDGGYTCTPYADSKMDFGQDFVPPR